MGRTVRHKTNEEEVWSIVAFQGKNKHTNVDGVGRVRADGVKCHFCYNCVVHSSNLINRNIEKFEWKE